MNFDIHHTITYRDGTTLTPTNFCVGIELTKEEYCRLARALKENPVLDDQEEIADLVAKMNEKVIIADQWQNKNGSSRSTPLKKPRQIANISLSP